MVVPKAKVIREGRELIVNSEVLVPGDIVLLASGARVQPTSGFLAADHRRLVHGYPGGRGRKLAAPNENKANSQDRGRTGGEMIPLLFPRRSG